MSRLTERDKNGIVIMIRPQEANNQLAELEDVLEEFGIESVQELKARLQSESQLASDGYKLALENEDLTKQLSKAIVPKFENGEEAYGIIDTMAYRDVFPVKIVGTNLVYEVDDGYSGTTMQHSSRIFKTEAEAQAKLDEIRRK